MRNYPNTLYVRVEEAENTVCYDAHSDPSTVRESDPEEQTLGVYQFIGTVHTRAVLEISPVNDSMVRDRKTGSLLLKPKRRK